MSRIKGWKIEKKFKDGAVIYKQTTSSVYPGVGIIEILIAELTNGRWNVEPSTIIFKARSFATKAKALSFAINWMRKHPNE